MVYLDNAATTEVHPKVLEAMMDCLKHTYGNASAKYYPEALAASELVTQARFHTSNLLGVKPLEVIFTSGATESNNIILRGLAKGFPTKSKHIITTHGEHSSVKEVLEYLEREEQYEITYLSIDRHGNIDLNELERAIQPTTLLVTIGWVNSELGTIQPMEQIDQICTKKGVLLHSDATQAVGKLPMDLSEFESLRFLSLSAHKFHGPKGIGAAILRNDPDGVKYKIQPLMYGGEQEGSMRPGTLPVHNIVGMGVACQLAHHGIKKYILEMKEKDQLVQQELTRLFGLKLSVRDFENRLPGILSIKIEGIINQLFLKKISDKISASTGSACSINKPSTILKEAGYEQKEIEETIRISFNQGFVVNDLSQISNI
jgi:cysteine desulfurase